MGELAFEGRVALVTGGGRGIGRSHALSLAARGARVVVADYGGSLEGTGRSSSQPADEVADEIRSKGGEAVVSHASVADPEGAQAMIDAAISSFGRLDVVVNNAGISNLELFDDLDIEDFRRMADVHYLGTVHVTRAAWPILKAAKYGRIVNTCSEGMLGIHKFVTSYGGAKGGVFGFTRTLAAEAPEHGILVNAIAPRANTRLGSIEAVMKTFSMPRETVNGIMGAMRPELTSPAAIFLAHESCRLNGEVFATGAGQVQRMTVQLTPGIFDAALTPEIVSEKLEQLMDLSGSQAVLVQDGRETAS